MIRPIALAELRARGPALFVEAAAETGTAGDVQWPCLEALERCGALVLFAVEIGDDLVGYGCAAVSPEFWSAELSCRTLSVYVRAQNRWRWGMALLRAIAREADARGASLTVQVLPGSRLERLVQLLGFEARAVAYRLATVQYTAHHGRLCAGRDRVGVAGLRRGFGRAAGRCGAPEPPGPAEGPG